MTAKADELAAYLAQAVYLVCTMRIRRSPPATAS